MKHLPKYLLVFLVIALALSGCSLIRVNEEADNAQVVAEFKGGTILKGPAMEEFDRVVEYYAMYGVTNASQLESLKPEILAELAKEKILELKAEEMDLMELSEEEKAELMADVEKRFNDSVDQYIDYYREGEMTDEEARAAVLKEFENQGFTLLTAQESEMKTSWKKRLKDEVTKDVAFTEADIESAFADHVAKDEEQYANDPSAFESAMENGESVAWHPEGYRTAKYILVSYTDDQSAMITDLDNRAKAIDDEITAIDDELSRRATEDVTADYEDTGEDDEIGEMDTGIDPDLLDEDETVEEDNAALSDEMLASKKAGLQDEKVNIEKEIETKRAEFKETLQPKVMEIMAKIEAGEDFDALIAEYGVDTSMEIEPVKSTGAFFSNGTTEKEKGLVDAVMALGKPNDVGVSGSGARGVYIVKYLSDVSAGAVDMNVIRAELEEEVLESLKDDHYNEMVNQWVEDADVKYYVERMRKLK